MGHSSIKPLGKSAALAVLVTFLVSGMVYAAESSSVPTLAPPPTEPYIDVKNNQDNLKWRQESCQNYRRELKDIVREANATDVTQVNALLDKCDAQVNTCQSLVATETFRDCVRDYDDLNRDIDDLFVDFLRPQRQCVQNLESAKGRRRELKDIDRQIKEMKRDASGSDFTAVDTWRTEVEALISKCEQIVTTCNRDVADDGDSCRKDVDDKFQDWYSDLSQKANVARQRKDLERTVKDKERNIKDFRREIKRVKNPDFETCVNNAEQKLGELKACVTNPALEDPQDCWDINREYDDLVGDQEVGCWAIQNKANEEQNLAQCRKDREREHKGQLKQVKDLRREEAKLTKKMGAESVAKLTACINVYEQALNEAALLIPTDQCHEYGNIVYNLEPIGEDEQSPPGGCWDIMNRLQQVGDITRLFKEFERSVKQNNNECRRIEKEASRRGSDATQVLALCSEFQQTLETLRKYHDGKDSDSFFDVWNEVHSPDGIWQRWGDTLRDFWESGQTFEFCQEIPNIEREISEGKQHLEELRSDGKIDEALYKDCQNFIILGGNLTGYGNKACQEKDRGALEKIGQELEALGERAELRCGVLFDEEPEEVHYEEVAQSFVGVSQGDLEDFGKRFSEDLRAQIFEKVIVQLQEELLKKIAAALEDRFKNAIALMLENLSVLNPGASQQVIQDKLTALDCAASVKELSTRPGGEKLQDIISRVESANPVGESAKALQNICEIFVSRAKDFKDTELAEVVAEFSGQIDEVLIAAGKESVEKGITCFADVPLDQWYHKEICGAARYNLIEGGKLGAEPGRNVNVAELLKITARIFDVDPPKGCPESVGCDQWFAPYFLWAEGQGLSIVKGKVEPGRPATRGEVVRTILEAAGRSAEPSETPFVDVPKRHPLSGFIAQAAEMSLVSGTKDKSGRRVFYPDRHVLRGEAARISRNAILFFGEIGLDTEDDGSRFFTPSVAPPSQDEDGDEDEDEDSDDDEEFDDEDSDEGEE